ncbi:MAG: hypothetical protein Q7R76_00610 [Candidatus Woesearchaeota archaeon]|nr:hypothetical protein [Candidatus Woesearchaeota archaeon]
MTMNKRAMELSVNMFVMLTIAIVVFAFGIKFVKDMFSTSSQLAETSFKDADRAIQDLACASAERVCLPASTRTLDGSKPAFFGVVVENVLPNEEEFTIQLNGAQGSCPTGLQTLPPCGESRKEKIKSKEKTKVGIAVVNNGADNGKTYTYTVTVNKADGTMYASAPLLFYVHVP